MEEKMSDEIKAGDLKPGTVLYRVRHAGVSPRSIQRATVLTLFGSDRVAMRGQRGNMWSAACAGLTASGYALTEAGAARLAVQQWARVVADAERTLEQARAAAAEAGALLASLTGEVST